MLYPFKNAQAINAGKIVLANRFTGSSMGHQGAKFNTAEERRGFFIWLDNLEFEMLRIPRPDANFVLRVPADVREHGQRQLALGGAAPGQRRERGGQRGQVLVGRC